MVLASSVLTSNLVPNRDRIAIACIDGSEKDGVGLLLPLGFHSFEASRTALNTFSLRQLQKKLKRSSDTGKSIRRVSQLFCRSPRAAFCHLVFISANPPENLCISGVDPAIGFHTMSSELSFPIQTATRPLGWHIYYDATADDPHSSEVHFMRKVSKVVRQLRTGLNPGVISQLRLFFDQGYGCQFESAMEDSRLAYLRPGETWILKVRIGVPIETYQKAQFTGHPMLEEMISEIDSVLEVYSPGPTAQHVFSARLEYQHSLLPTPHAVCLETHCTISHIPGVPLGAPGDDNKIPRLASYELDDEAISISLGSASESS